MVRAYSLPMFSGARNLCSRPLCRTPCSGSTVAWAEPTGFEGPQGLGNDKGSSRINRYERQVTAIGFDNPDTLAEVLDVPIAYLVAENPAMADGILELSRADTDAQEKLVLALRALMASPTLAEAIARLASAPDEERTKLTEALSSLLSPPAKKRGK